MSVESGQGGGSADTNELLFVLGSSQRVHLRGVEDRLSDLWRMTGEEARARGQAGVMRVRVLNLIVYAESETMADRVSSIVPLVAQCHPARVIVLLDKGVEQEDEEVLDAWITAACYLTHEGGRQVCWEQVTIPAAGKSVAQLEVAAMPYLVPDLPVVLWWPGEPRLGSKTFWRLSEVSDRIMIDSAGLAEPLAGLSAAAEVLRRADLDFSLEDLNWSRLTPWRELLAELFDQPERRALLDRLDRLEIVFGPERDPVRAAGEGRFAVVRALLAAGWLMSRLGRHPQGREWEPQDGGWRVVLGRDPEGLGRPAVELVLRADEEPSCDYQGLLSVSLEAAPEGDAPPTSVGVWRSRDTCVFSAGVREGAEERLLRSGELQEPSEDQLLCEELEFPGGEEVYFEALRAAVELATLPGSEALGARP